MSEEWAETSWTVLIVDDDPDILRVAQRALLPEGLAILTTTDPKQGFTMARDNPIHLVILDIEMPGEDGLSVLRRLQADEWTQDIPVIMLTARGGLDDFGEAREKGAFDYVTKPFVPQTLIRRVRRAFSYAYFGRDKITETDGTEFRQIPPHQLEDFGGAAAKLIQKRQAAALRVHQSTAGEEGTAAPAPGDPSA